jgi:hypothetical protein
VAVAGWAATVLAVVLAVGLLVGVRLRAVTLASGALLVAFAIAMTVARGPEPPLAYSVWTAAAGAFLLASVQPPVRTGAVEPNQSLQQTAGA